MDLNGKCVLLGVTGGIAAYKMANVASALRKLGADVEVIMTRNATQFITPITFETLTGHKCMVDTFDRDFKFEVTHIALAKKADVILVAPATARTMNWAAKSRAAMPLRLLMGWPCRSRRRGPCGCSGAARHCRRAFGARARCGRRRCARPRTNPRPTPRR